MSPEEWHVAVITQLTGLQIRLEFFLERFASAMALDMQAHNC